MKENPDSGPVRHALLSVVRWFDSYAGVEEMAGAPEKKIDLWRVVPFLFLHLACLGVAAPVILYLNDAPHLFDLTLESGADVLSIGARVDMASAARRAGRRASLQGNLDPAELARGRARVFARRSRTRRRTGRTSSRGPSAGACKTPPQEASHGHSGGT